MKKLFFISCFTILFVRNIFGQAQVDIQLVAFADTINHPLSIFPLSVGLDLTATNCIDPQLGEADLPPVPPSYLEVRLHLYPYGCGPLSTYVDYRAPGNPPIFPFTGVIEHTLMYCCDFAGTPLYISYDIPSGAMMYITDPVGGSFLNLGPFNGIGVATIPGSYTAIFSSSLLKMEYNNIVPVELTSFTASVLQNEKAVQLNWTTATETNNSGFEVERARLRSSNYAVASWESIGFVPGFGTTTEPKSYSFIDENVTTGAYRYRLKQMDFDGSFNYSNEIEVEVDFTPKEFVLYQNYPNPFNPGTVIGYQLPVNGNVTLKVYDILGNEVATLVNEYKTAGRYEVEFDGSSLASGMYLYKLQVGTFVQTKKMILIK